MRSARTQDVLTPCRREANATQCAGAVRLRARRGRLRWNRLGYAAGVFADDLHALSELTVKELLAELTRVEDRLREQAHHAGPRPLPGQVSREAALRRRERLLLAELSSRRAAVSPDPVVQPMTATPEGRLPSGGPIAPEGVARPEN
jgi:hypothetical protein